MCGICNARYFLAYGCLPVQLESVVLVILPGIEPVILCSSISCSCGMSTTLLSPPSLPLLSLHCDPNAERQSTSVLPPSGRLQDIHHSHTAPFTLWSTPSPISPAHKNDPTSLWSCQFIMGLLTPSSPASGSGKSCTTSSPPTHSFHGWSLYSRERIKQGV